jgi:hypothetical protein
MVLIFQLFQDASLRYEIILLSGAGRQDGLAGTFESVKLVLRSLSYLDRRYFWRPGRENGIW